MGQVNEILVPKTSNRYYMLEKLLEEADETYEVQVYGSCHSYTSFDALYFQETYGTSSYVMANPGEIIPSTYLRMKERFKIDVPSVVLLDIWGLNAYETYSTRSDIFDYYFPVNIERIPFSLEKLEVIMDYESLDLVSESFAITKYKDRILNGELVAADFDYEFSKDFYYEMAVRSEHNGLAAYTDATVLDDYWEKQPDIGEDEQLAYEADIMKYVEKIIDLCEQNGVELIFYRAPYISTENELRKANWFGDYCESRGILFLDLEEEMEFDLSTDFLDYHHLNASGARKATMFLSQYILDAMK